ncbi:unnamed protein product [Gongylonema pulchrum]|uniref:DUF2098 domain-containing protein n=1 Tax=Gongylonema pulchrum TaxID=637853 RepID=A0A183EXU1_9BILA|nr:unnamed protein product [Gongylonema pulchrum]
MAAEVAMNDEDEQQGYTWEVDYAEGSRRFLSVLNNKHKYSAFVRLLLVISVAYVRPSY